MSDTTGQYRCFACGAAGDALRFEAEARGLPTRQAALEPLAQRYPEAAAVLAASSRLRPGGGGAAVAATAAAPR